MTRSGLVRLWVLLLAVAMLLTSILSGFTPGLNVHAQVICDHFNNPCTDTPAYPTKESETPTYPPKVSETPTDPPEPSLTTVIQEPSQTSTLKPTVIYRSSTPTDTATLKPTVLGITSTSLSTVTATLVPAIPISQPTYTVQPQSLRTLPFVDLLVTGIEVTQAIQIFGTSSPLDNSIPLVSRKKTVVRVYVRIDRANYSDVTGRLTVTGGGSPGRIHSPIAYNPSGTITGDWRGSDRNYESSTLNFILDQDEVLSGDRHLSVTVYFNRGRLDSNLANNTSTLDIHFQPVPSISIYGVAYGNDGTELDTPFLAAPPWSDMLAHAAIAKNMAPVSNLNVWYFPGMVGGARMFPNLELAREWADRMLARPEYSSNRIYLLQPEGDCACGGALRRRLNGQNARGVSTGTIMAQEVAHSYGMGWHAVSSEHPADYPNSLFPWIHSSVGTQVGAKTEPLFAAMNPLPGRVNHLHDFMSYGPSPSWVSPFTYCDYLTTLTSRAVTCPAGAERAKQLPVPPAKTAIHTADIAQGTYIYIAGTLFPDGTTSFEPFEQMTSVENISRIPAGDAYHLVFMSADAIILRIIPFTPVETHHAEINPTLLFNLTVPYPSKTSSILLQHNGQTLAERNVSPHAPSVQFDFAGNDQVLKGTQTFNWSADDADGDALIYAIEFSRDHGNSWLTLNVGMTTPAADVNFDALPGTQLGMLRIVASDGVNSSEARSTGLFRVEPKKPVITSISDDTTTYQGQPVYAEITAFDWEDGSITEPAAITWASDRDGSLTSGPWIAPGELSAGEHTLTATVRDSDGNTTSKSMHISVLPADTRTAGGPVSIYAALLKYGAILLGVVILLAGATLVFRQKKKYRVQAVPGQRSFH